MTSHFFNHSDFKKIKSCLEKHHIDYRLVGGAVRDWLKFGAVSNNISNKNSAEQTSCDMDFAVAAPPYLISDVLIQAGIRVIPTGIEHGTVTALGERGSMFELTSLRKDIAPDGRHSKVQFGVDWLQDAARRDFTINSIYLSPDGTIFDPFNGQADLENNCVRFIGNADDRIKEDYLRCLRFIRFSIQFSSNDQALDSEGLAACQASIEHLNDLSGERIGQEMFKTLKLGKLSLTIRFLRQIGAVPYIFGVSNDFDDNDTERVKKLDHLTIEKIDEQLRLLILLGGDEREQSRGQSRERFVSDRWRLSRKISRRLKAHEDIGEFTELSQASLYNSILGRFGNERAFDLLILTYCQGNLELAELNSLMGVFSQPIIKFPVSGSDLMVRGLKEGEIIGKNLERLKNMWLRSNCTMLREDLLQHILHNIDKN